MRPVKLFGLEALLLSDSYWELDRPESWRPVARKTPMVAATEKPELISTRRQGGWRLFQATERTSNLGLFLYLYRSYLRGFFLSVSFHFFKIFEEEGQKNTQE